MTDRTKPEPSPDPGTVPQRLRRDPVGTVEALARGAEVLPRFSIGEQTCVIVRRPSQVHEVFVAQARRVHKPRFLSDSNRGHFGDGLTTLEGVEWKARRALLRPAFDPAAITQLCHVAARQTRQMVERWQDGRTVELRPQLRLLVARNAARFVFGAEVEGWPDADATTGANPVLPVDEVYGESFTAVATEDGATPLALTRPRAPKAMPRARALIERRCRTPGDGLDVLSRLARSGLGHEAIEGEVLQMLYAGHHTTVQTLVHLLAMLHRHPQVAARVRGEAGFERPAAGVDARGAFVETVLRETMRLHAPAPLLYRQVSEPFALGGVTLDEGTGVWACPHALHRDPTLFEDPERFDPQRFAGAAGGLARHSYLPFGAGPRICIAHRLAIAQMKAIVREIVTRVSLGPVDAQRWLVERRPEK